MSPGQSPPQYITTLPYTYVSSPKLLTVPVCNSIRDYSIISSYSMMHQPLTRLIPLLATSIAVGYYSIDWAFNDKSTRYEVKSLIAKNTKFDAPHVVKGDEEQYRRRRRLSSSESDDGWFKDVPHILSLATSQLSSQTTTSQEQQLKVLLVVTSLVQYDKGTRGTQHGYDRLQNVVLPQLTDSVSSMVNKGWKVDVYFVLGYESLADDRRQMIKDALPKGIGLEYWEDAIPYHYANTYNKRPKDDQMLKIADHALSRQHRFVLRDKLPYYDFFACFEDDIRITAEHVINFLQLSSHIKQLHDKAMFNPDHLVHVEDESPPRLQRHQPNDGASFGNDVVDDPISAEHVKRLFPGLIRVEVLDRLPNHPLRKSGVLDNHRFVKEVPPSSNASTSQNGDGGLESILSPSVCCEEDEPGRGKLTPNPKMNELVLWETNIQATGVRKLPQPIGWVAVLPVEDRSDVGSWWSGYPDTYGESNMKRPRRIDATLAQQAGFMATRSQIQYFHDVACPGGFLPPFDSNHWKGDSLQRHSVEFWSGGFQLFGQCYLNRILPLDPGQFEKQLIYHVSNNKQRTISAKKVIRVQDFYGQILKVKERAEEFVTRAVT